MNTNANAKTIRFGALAAALAAVALLACLTFAPAAFANRQMNAPTTVSDDITRVHVNKLDADTHEFVQGASMAIIEKETGTVVDEWVTGSATHANEKHLDVDKVYILREVTAPDGYEKVEDTEFIVNATEGTGITVLSGPGELTESYKVNLYDKAETVTNEKVVTKTRGATSTSKSSSTKTVAPKTGDETPITLVALLVVIGVLAIGILEIPKRRAKE